MTTMSHVLRFSVSGDSLTQLARGPVVEGNWKHGLAILLEGLEGMTHDPAIAILKGEKRLEGRDNNLSLADEPPLVTRVYLKECQIALLGDVLIHKNRRQDLAFQVIEPNGEEAYALFEASNEESSLPFWMSHYT